MTALIKWKNHRIEDVEVNLLLQALNERYGYDFTGYARASLKRRLRELMIYFDLPHLTQLIPTILYNEAVAQTVINSISVPTSEFFRDPFVWAYLRENVIPQLASFPRINIWQAGVGFGQEAYTLSILLHEAGLEKRSHIFCTDINPEFLNEAKKGSWATRNLALWRDNYQKSGGTGDFDSYFIEQKNSIALRANYKQHIEFIQHNLVNDDVFKEIQFVVCRNVLLYFGEVLQNRVVNLFTRSLERGGYLLLGSGENILELETQYPRLESIDYSLQLYRKTMGITSHV
jgi:chemotaxis protein methyltransferase CheR